VTKDRDNDPNDIGGFIIATENDANKVRSRIQIIRDLLDETGERQLRLLAEKGLLPEFLITIDRDLQVAPEGSRMSYTWAASDVDLRRGFLERFLQAVLGGDVELPETVGSLRSVKFEGYDGVIRAGRSGYVAIFTLKGLSAMLLEGLVAFGEMFDDFWRQGGDLDKLVGKCFLPPAKDLRED